MKKAKNSHYTQTTMMHGEKLEVHITHAHRFSIKVLRHTYTVTARYNTITQLSGVPGVGSWGRWVGI